MKNIDNDDGSDNKIDKVGRKFLNTSVMIISWSFLCPCTSEIFSTSELLKFLKGSIQEF